MAAFEISEYAPGLVHPILTDEQALLVHQALLTYLNQTPGSISEHEDEEARVKQMVSELVYFFGTVVEHPEQFGLRSHREAQAIIRGQKAALKGPAQPKSRRNKRKARQAARKGMARSRREQRKDAEMRAAWNEARQKMEDEQLEAQEDFQRQAEWYLSRFESIAAKETVTAEELQEVLTYFGAPEAAITRMQELQPKSPDERLLDAARKRDAEPED